MHRIVEPKILYLGTPVVLISTTNENGTANLAPMSSAWWLGMSCMLGLGSRGQTIVNLQRDRECVLNLPSADLVDAVDRLALTTGKNPVPEYKARMNFRFEPRKFECARLTPVPSDCVGPPRVKECPIQLEARVENIYTLGRPEDHHSTVDVTVVRTHIAEELLDSEKRHHVDPDRWQPLIMNFLEFYSLTGQIHRSRLASVF